METINTNGPTPNNALVIVSVDGPNLTESEGNMTGDLWFGYVGPWFDGGVFSKHELHLGFVASGLGAIERREAWANANRYSKFHRIHPGAKRREWTKLVLTLRPLVHVVLGESTLSILLNNELYGQTFGLLFNNVPLEQQAQHVLVDQDDRKRAAITQTQMIIAKFISIISAALPDGVTNPPSTSLALVFPKLVPSSCTIL